MGKGCVRFKSLEDLALDVRFAGREPYGGRPRAVASWSREAGDIVLVKTGRPHRCARVRGGPHGQLPGGKGAHGQGKEQRKEGRQEVRGEESRRCVALVGNQLYGGRRQAKRERLGSRAPTLGMSVNHKAGTLLMH